MTKNLILNYLKLITDVVIKLFFVSAVTMLILFCGTLAFDVNANAMYSDASIVELLKRCLQHIPHIGMLIEEVLQIIGATTILEQISASGIDFSVMESEIYNEVLLCCIYMIIVWCQDRTIQIITKNIKRFMKIGRITKWLSDLMVYITSYILAIGVADIVYAGIIITVSPKIACWIIAATFIFVISVVLIRKRTVLITFLKIICGGLLDILQLVLIYSLSMSLYLLGNTANSIYLTDNESVLLITFLSVTSVILVVLFIKRLLYEKIK